jgi:Mn2+/Fe2+ NRAMP family transporter
MATSREDDEAAGASEKVGSGHIVHVIAILIALAATVSVAMVLAYTIWVVATGFRDWEETLREHFAAIVGLPGAAVVAFILVVFLRQTDGPIEFEGLGFKFKGAAGQVAMWVICFLAIAGAIHLCW